MERRTRLQFARILRLSTRAGSLLLALSLAACVATDRRAGAVSAYEPERLQGHEDYVSDVAFAPDGNTFASAGLDGRLLIWDSPVPGSTENPAVAGGARNATSDLRALAFFPDGQHVCVGSSVGEVAVYSVPACQLTASFTIRHSPVTDLAVATNGSLIAVGHVDGTVSLCRPDGTVVTSIPGQESGSAGPLLAFSPDGRLLAVTLGNRLTLFSTSNWEKTTEVAACDSAYGVHSLAFSPDSRMLAVGGHCIVTLWRMPDCVRMVRNDLHGHFGKITAVAFSPDGRLLASGGGVRYYDSKIRIWQLRTDKELCELQAHEMPVSGLAFSPDGRLLLSGAWDETIMVSDVNRLTGAR